jgi:hypothetical protein
MSDDTELKNLLEKLRTLDSKRHLGKATPEEIREIGATQGRIHDIEEKALKDAFTEFYTNPTPPTPCELFEQTQEEKP